MSDSDESVWYTHSPKLNIIWVKSILRSYALVVSILTSKIAINASAILNDQYVILFHQISRTEIKIGTLNARFCDNGDAGITRNNCKNIFFLLNNTSHDITVIRETVSSKIKKRIIWKFNVSIQPLMLGFHESVIKVSPRSIPIDYCLSDIKSIYQISKVFIRY